MLVVEQGWLMVEQGCVGFRLSERGSMLPKRMWWLLSNIEDGL